MLKKDFLKKFTHHWKEGDWTLRFVAGKIDATTIFRDGEERTLFPFCGSGRALCKLSRFLREGGPASPDSKGRKLPEFGWE